MWVRSISFDAKNAGWNCNVMMRHIALMEENAMMEASINGFVHTENEIRLKDNYLVKSDINIW